MTSQIILIRHPPVALPAGTCYGCSDVPLLDDPAALAQALRAQLPTRFLLFSSPLQRCLQLAELLGNAHIEPRLQEINFGDWELRPWQSLPRAGLDAWAADSLYFHPPGGESVAELAARSIAALLDMQGHATAAGLPLVIISHGGPLRAIIGHLRQEAAAIWMARDIPHATPLHAPFD